MDIIFILWYTDFTSQTGGYKKAVNTMTDNEVLNLILSEMQGMKTDIQTFKSDMLDMKSDMQDMKSDIQNLKADMQDVKSDIRKLNVRVDNLESQLKQTERNLRKEIHKECSLVLDEVERVHTILDKHKADKTMHPAWL